MKFVKVPNITEAMINVGGIKDCIYGHIVSSLRIKDEEKLRKPKVNESATHFIVQGVEFDVSMMEFFVKLMWYKYVSSIYRESKSVRVDSEVDESEAFSQCKKRVLTCFEIDKGKSIIDECSDFIALIKDKPLWNIDSDFLCRVPNGHILINPTGAHGLMNEKISKVIAFSFPEFADNYFTHCKQFGFRRDSIGTTLTYSAGSYVIANVVCSIEDATNGVEVSRLIEGLLRFRTNSPLCGVYKLGVNMLDDEWSYFLKTIRQHNDFHIIA